MKDWKRPELEELALSQTAYFQLTGDVADGAYVSYDGKYTQNTYSGVYEKDVPFTPAH